MSTQLRLPLALEPCKGRHWDMSRTYVGGIIQSRMSGLSLTHKDIKEPRLLAFLEPFNMDCGKTRVRDVESINLFIDHILNKGSFMSNKPKTPIVPPKKTASGKPSWGGFCNVVLTPEQKEDFYSLLESTGTDPMGDIESLMGMGKLSLQVSEDKAVTATLTVVHENKQWAMSAFAEQVDMVLAVLLYKTHIHPTWYENPTSVTIRSGIG